MERKYNEKIIINDGKLVYAIQISEKSERTCILMERGQIKFGERYFTEYSKFNFNDEAHQIAKDIFITQLQTDIKSKIGELKLLEEVFKSINMQECLGTTIPDSSKILLEAKQHIDNKLRNTDTKLKKEMKEIKAELINEVETQIEENVKPIARKKKKVTGGIK